MGLGFRPLACRPSCHSRQPAGAQLLTSGRLTSRHAACAGRMYRAKSACRAFPLLSLLRTQAAPGRVACRIWWRRVLIALRCPDRGNVGMDTEILAPPPSLFVVCHMVLLPFRLVFRLVVFRLIAAVSVAT